jgi:hypothetical protein
LLTQAEWCIAESKRRVEATCDQIAQTHARIRAGREPFPKSDAGAIRDDLQMARRTD